MITHNQPSARSFVFNQYYFCNSFRQLPHKRATTTILAKTMAFLDHYTLSIQFQTLNQVEDSLDSCRLSRKLQIVRTVAYFQYNCRKLQNVKSAADSCRPLQTCLFLSVQIDGQSLNSLKVGAVTMACLSHKGHIKTRRGRPVDDQPSIDKLHNIFQK